MKAKLRVLRGKLKTRKGDNAGFEIEVRGARFLIGSSRTCKLCCPSEVISAQHCELTRTTGALWVNDLGSRTGTFLNDVRTIGTTRVAHGDRLRVGRLEFEVVLVEPEPSTVRRDSMSEFVSELLNEADAEDRARRMADPTSRQFDTPTGELNAPPTNPDSATAQASLPTRRPPQKLPPPPNLVSDDSVQAADETLKKIMARLKGPKR